jgi:uncharacterized membrane protein
VPIQSTPVSPPLQQKRRLAFVVSAFIVILLFWHWSIDLSNYRAFRFFTDDIGHFNYMLWHTLHGRFFWSIVHQCNHFALHFTPSLLLLVPLHFSARPILVLPLTETLAIFSGSVATSCLFAGAVAQGRSPVSCFTPTGLLLGLVFVCSPLTGAILLSYHIESFAVALMLWALAAYYQHWRKTFWVFLFLSLGVKEDIAIYWAWFALWAMMCERRYALKTNALLLIASLLWLAVAFWSIEIFIAASNKGVWAYGSRYATLGNTLPEKIVTVTTHPRLWLEPLQVQGLTSLFAFACIPVLAPTALLLLLPGLYIMGLSAFSPMYHLSYYYSYALVPFLALGAVKGVARVVGWRRLRRGRKVIVVVVNIVLLAAAVALCLQRTRTEGRRRLPATVTARHVELKEEMGRLELPIDATIAAQADLLPQLPMREGMMPLSLENALAADYCVVDVKGFYGDQSGWRMREILAAMEREVGRGSRRVVIQKDGLLVFRRSGDWRRFE